MILRWVWCFVFAIEYIIVGVRLDPVNELPDCTGRYGSDNLGSTVFVSTLDGRITALNGHEAGTVKWHIDASSPLLSSSIHKLELTNNGHWVRMIPSLSGGLYKFNGVDIEMLPVRADHLLQSSSFLLSDGLVISGGRETRVYSIALDTGEVLYECSMEGCNSFKNISNNMVIIQKQSQTVRAVDVHTGNERWNFSVGQYEVKMAPNSASCNVKHSEQIPDLDIRAIIPEGLVYAVQKSEPRNIIWQHKFSAPVVAIWKMERGSIENIDLFHENVWSTYPENSLNNGPALYLGMHQKQLYIQESVSLQATVKKNTYMIESASSRNLQIPWEPVAVPRSALGSVAIPVGDSKHEDDAPTTALSVLYASEYVNGNGYFLFNKSNFEKSDEQCSRGEENNRSATRDDFVNDQETPVHIIVSLWYWWKEVLIISVTTAVLVNIIVTQRVLQIVQEPAEKEIFFVKKSSFEKENSENVSSPGRTSESKNEEYTSRYLLDFEPVRCLGKGGFGVVFEAKNKIDECNYAIKRIALPNSLESRDRVLREVKALAKLDHQHIVRYFNAWMECPPSGWVEHHDSVHLKRHPQILDSNFATEETSNSVREVLVEETSRILKESMLDGPAHKSSDVLEENDSFIIFEKSESSKMCPTTDHVSVNVESTDHDVSSSLESLDNHASHTNQCSEVTSSEDLSVQIVSPPTRMYLYIQMQLCLKESLREWLYDNVTKRDRKKMLQIFEQIVHAVEYIHLEGLIHRDLKPSNIFFSLNGQIKVGDFGLVTTIAKDMSDICETKTKFDKEGKHTAQVGTQLYMSPEQVEGLPYDYKVDIYSLGVILFELLYPFSTQMERADVLLALRRNMFPESFKDEFKDEYELLNLMLSQNPEKRPTTFGIRARPPLAEGCTTSKEEATYPQWHFTLPIQSNSINNPSLSRV
ncbi:Eukaryotic translation initiation factor 2-alpha kinase [Gryllus bimaculatus]|nr:Eukaryotic translation initiation factor 2-alpha kinase [Gryllus bimaculatus]